jgi:hypothetical protein
LPNVSKFIAWNLQTFPKIPLAVLSLFKGLWGPQERFLNLQIFSPPEAGHSPAFAPAGIVGLSERPDLKTSTDFSFPKEKSASFSRLRENGLPRMIAPTP